MTVHSSSQQQPVEGPVTTASGNAWIQGGFLAIAILFNLCLTAQLLTVGLAVFSDSSWWQIHVWLVRGYSGLAGLLLIGTFLAPFPKRIQALTKGIAILLILQFVTAHVQQPIPLGVIHPLVGFALFTTSTTLVHKILSLIPDKSGDAPANQWDV